jgi:hypothetical protein
MSTRSHIIILSIYFLESMLPKYEIASSFSEAAY